MTLIKSSVFHVLEKFPDRAGDIKRLYKKSQDFKLCVTITANAKRLCVTGINRMKKRLRPAEMNTNSCFRN